MQGVSLRRIRDGQPGAGMAVVRLHYSSDPERWNPENVAALRATYTSDARWRREMECEYEALEGELLYPEFRRDTNCCAPFDVSDPSYWTIWMACDPHPRTAHAMVWEAFNKHHDRVVCGELWPEFGTRYGPNDGVRWKTKDYADAIQLFESDSELKPSPFIWSRGKRLRVFRRIMDTFGKAANSDEGDGEDYFETYRRLGVEMSKKAELMKRPSERVNLSFDAALKGHDNLAKAYDAIGRALAVRKDASGYEVPPSLRVFEDCYETIDECENVRYPKTKKKPGDDFGLDGGAGQAAGETVVTFQRHALDCLAYIETARPKFVMPKRQTGEWEPLDKDTGY